MWPRPCIELRAASFVKCLLLLSDPICFLPAGNITLPTLSPFSFLPFSRLSTSILECHSTAHGRDLFPFSPILYSPRRTTKICRYQKGALPLLSPRKSSSFCGFITCYRSLMPRRKKVSPRIYRRGKIFISHPFHLQKKREMIT